MKKRILSIMLLCYMVLGLLPTTVFANNDGTKAIQLGTSGISGYDSTNNSYDYIHFGTWDNSTVKWRVLDTKTNMPNAQEGDGFFLLSDALLGTGEFGGVEFDYTTPYTNDWRGSRAQDWCNGFYNRNLSTTEQKAVFATSKSDDPYIDGYFMGSENILNGDKVFFLSAEEVRKVAYGFIDDNARIANYGDSAGGWWLRSPHRDYNAAGVVSASGGVSAEWVNDTNAARPAFNLKPDSVLLVSAAVGGKGAADGIFKIPEYSGDEWKLTLLDDTRTFRVTETAAVGKPGGSVTLNFSGARTGQNEYISAIIEGESGATHYGRIMKPTAADTQLSFTLPYDLDSGNYKLYVFSEQCNGDYKTDYASRFQAVALTVEEAANEQFDLVPGGRYYFDLSAMGIPGTANGSLPDASLHYVPFTYAGTVDAYKLTSEMATTEEYAQQNEYAHSLFVADYAVTHAVSWDKLHAEGLIFGKGYAAGSVEYTMRAPSGGSAATSNYSLGTPQSNEWDRILDKNGGYIKNWGKMESWGQDTSPYTLSNRVVRGYHSPRKFADANTTLDFPYFGFRPVLEVLNPDTLGTDGLKAVTLDLGGGKLGGSPDTIQIIVKTGESFTAPASDGLTRPDGNTGSYFKWLGSDGNLYAPGDNVPAVVTRLTAQFDSSSHSVTITFNGNGGTGTMDSVTVKAGANYTLPACGFTEPEGKQFNGWSTSADGSVISGTSYEVSSDTTFYAIWESKEYSIIVTDGKATIGAGSEISKAAQGTTITLTANAAPDGKVFDKWVVESGNTTLEDATSETTTFIMPDSEVSVKATYKNAPVTTYSLTTQVNGGHGTISASKTGLTEGSTETVIFTPDDGYEIDLVTVNGVATDVHSNTLNVTMDADKTVIVTYKAIPHTHTYDQEIQKPETLKSAADCTNDAVYFKSCSCGEISTTETFTAAGTQLGHAWASDWSKDTDNHWKICSRCHEKKDEAAHDYGSDNICDTCGYDKTVPHTHNLTLVPAKAPTCTEKGNTAYYTCDGCDKWFEDATGASEITDKTSVILAATGHSVSDWKSDHTDHWKECTVVGCGVIIEDSKAVHTAGEWIIDTPATATTSGSKHKECTVCGYTMAAETIPATGGGEHTHSYSSDWKYDADNHWHECSCGDKADKAAHDFKWVVDKEATATQKGSKHEECKVCGYKKAAVEIPATGLTTKPTDPTQTNPNTGTESPKTGDNSNMILWIPLLFISGGAVIGITVYRKKKKENAE